MSLRARHQWSEVHHSKINIAQARHRQKNASSNEEFFNDYSIIQERGNSLRNTSAEWTHQISSGKNQWSFGQQFLWYQTGQSTRYVNRYQDQEERYENRYQNGAFLWSNFGEWIFNPEPRWNLRTGIRQQFYSKTSEYSIDPQVQIQYDPTEAWTFKSYWGRNRQFLVAIPETYFTLSNAQEQVWVLSENPGQNPIINQQLVLGFLFQKYGWVLDFETYRKKITGVDAVRLNPLLTNGGSTEEKIIGLDMLIKKRFRYVRWWISQSLQNSTSEIPSLEINNMPSMYQIHFFTQVAATFDLKPFQFSVGSSFHSGLPYNRALGFEPTEAFYSVVYDELNGFLLPAYHRLDFSAWYEFGKTKEQGLQGRVGVSILNLLNQKNIGRRNYYVDDQDDGNFSLFQTDIALYGITPNVSLQIKL